MAGAAAGGGPGLGSGALIGAGIGSIVPGVGTIAGAVIGAGVGMAAGYLGKKKSIELVFGDLGVQVVNGHRFLGGVIGDCMTVDNFVRKKVAMWVDCVEKLSKAATKSPQAAYTALSKSLQCEWSYLQRVMHNCGDAFVPLQDAIFKAFYPAWFEGDLSDAECTKFVVEAIKRCGEFSFASHLDAINRARHESRNALEEVVRQKLDTILATLSPGRQRAIMKIVEGKTSSWLTTLTLQSCHFDLAPVQFRDGLALRYLRHPSNLPAKFDGCGADFTLQHAFDSSQVWPQVIKEPVVNEATVVTDTDAPSHCHRAPNAILESSSQEKKKMYKTAVDDRRGTFSPFVLSVDGLLHKEASHFLRYMATVLSFKWDKAFSIASSYDANLEKDQPNSWHFGPFEWSLRASPARAAAPAC
eukprot:Em0012g368a